MKKLLYLLILFLICSSHENLKAQGFSFTNLGPVYVQIPYIPDSLQSVIRQAIVRNNSSSNLNFRFARIVNDMPTGWYTQMCYDLCYAKEVDTISLSFDPPYSIPPNHQDTMYYIDFYGTVQGLGTAIVRMYNTDNPSQYVQDTFKVQIGTIGITPISSIVEDYKLYQNYPNPFNPTTNINFSIPKSGIVSLKVYDILGNKVADLINNESINAGSYKIDFNGTHLSSGIYYYTLKTESAEGGFSDTKKMILLK